MGDSMSIVLQGSTSGSITLQEPAVAGTNTLTLPANTGTIITTASSAVVTPAMLTQPLTSGTAVASTSGTSIDFTSIPSWVKRITVIFSNVSTNGTSGILVRLGTSGGIVSTGYISTSVTLDSSGNSAGQTGTAGFNYYNDNASYAHYGSMTLSLVDSTNNIWVSNHVGRFSTTNMVSGGGGLTLSSVLTQVRITTVNGTNTFDAGSINIFYE